ncbi:MAG: ImmA/IrrE family metallo-endopeptidase [Nitrospirae bacterium]|nr:ImmA/IrrE family metallo-endopeptidase [Candidatus Manganitrophaceae bacterium]
MANLIPVREAQRLLKESKITQAPVDIEAIAKKLGAVVSYEVFKEDLSGVLVKESSRTVIGVNSVHSKTRQRFTIAHEIGHLILEHEGEVFVDQTVMKRDERSSQAIDIQEIEANKFAAELLMPESLIMAAVQNLPSKKPDISSGQLIEELAKAFQVSSQAMEYRLTNLGMFIPQ